MKKHLFVLAIMLLGTTAFAQTDSSTTPASGPVLTFETNKWDFGTIKQGDKVEHVFSFKNTGTEDLVITNIQVSCGCTAPEWPRDPIGPGQKGDIKIAFNSTGKSGSQTKVVTVVSNAVNNDNQITFTAMVEAPSQ